MNLKDLIDQGKIKAGTKLVTKKKGVVIRGTINANGTITTEDGQNFKSPSGAIRAFNGNKPVDGWLAWKIDDAEKRTLDSFRQ